MSIPLLVLLAFAGWTLAVLLGFIGTYRWSRILTGRAQLTDFRPDVPHGSDLYRRAMRAHANCLESLPVYAAIVVVLTATGLSSPWLDALAVTLLVARVFQSLTHILLPETNRAVALRFSFFLLQLVCMGWMGLTALTQTA
jgi:uncharacterized MAPEG superfamily protein